MFPQCGPCEGLWPFELRVHTCVRACACVRVRARVCVCERARTCVCACVYTVE
jgi:hypothetical protein